MWYIILTIVMLAVFILGFTYELYAALLDYKSKKYGWMSMEVFMSALFMIGIILRVSAIVGV